MGVTKKGKSITFEVRAWWNPKDQMIHLASDASKTFILTVCDDPMDVPKKNACGHRKLFRELSKLLLSAGVPAPSRCQTVRPQIGSPLPFLLTSGIISVCLDLAGLFRNKDIHLC